MLKNYEKDEFVHFQTHIFQRNSLCVDGLGGVRKEEMKLF